MQAHSHFCLQSATQSRSYILFSFSMTFFHSDECHNMEENMFCYFLYSVTLNLFKRIHSTHFQFNTKNAEKVINDLYRSVTLHKDLTLTQPQHFFFLLFIRPPGFIFKMTCIEFLTSHTLWWDEREDDVWWSRWSYHLIVDFCFESHWWLRIKERQKILQGHFRASLYLRNSLFLLFCSSASHSWKISAGLD